MLNLMPREVKIKYFMIKLLLLEGAHVLYPNSELENHLIHVWEVA